MDMKDIITLLVSFVAGYYIAAHYGATARPA